jgi:hypothetical protein
VIASYQVVAAQQILPAPVAASGKNRLAVDLLHSIGLCNHHQGLAIVQPVTRNLLSRNGCHLVFRNASQTPSPASAAHINRVACG